MSAPGCVACHNSHADSPKTDWKLGDVRGALEVSVPLEDMQAGVDGFILRTILIMGGIVLAIVFVLWGVLRRTSQQVNLAADAAARIADLNLSQKVPPSESNDEAGRLLAALANMQGHLRMMVSDISRHVTGINGSAGHLAEESARLAKTADTQAGAAGSVAQAVEEVSASMGEMKHHADGAFEISERSGNDARASADNAHRTAVEIRSIADSIRKLAGTMGELDKASSEISTVVGVIREVADQTNLLALNAAIEAARAGEAGRGFAVVADEVRKLAERTAQSTQMITATVERIQHGTRLSVEATEHNTSAAEGCESVAHQAGESVNAICAGMEQTLHAIESIQNALSEQERAIHIVADQAEGIARVTDESSAASHRVADSSRQISQMAEELNALASRFKV